MIVAIFFRTKLNAERTRTDNAYYTLVNLFYHLIPFSVNQLKKKEEEKKRTGIRLIRLVVKRIRLNLSM